MFCQTKRKLLVLFRIKGRHKNLIRIFTNRSREDKMKSWLWNTDPSALKQNRLSYLRKTPDTNSNWLMTHLLLCSCNIYSYRSYFYTMHHLIKELSRVSTFWLKSRKKIILGDFLPTLSKNTLRRSANLTFLAISSLIY